MTKKIHTYYSCSDTSSLETRVVFLETTDRSPIINREVQLKTASIRNLLKRTLNKGEDKAPIPKSALAYFRRRAAN